MTTQSQLRSSTMYVKIVHNGASKIKKSHLKLQIYEVLLKKSCLGQSPSLNTQSCIKGLSVVRDFCFFENTIASALKSCIINYKKIFFSFFFGVKLGFFRAAHILNCECYYIKLSYCRTGYLDWGQSQGFFVKSMHKYMKKVNTTLK